jgi:hypothetical protein
MSAVAIMVQQELARARSKWPNVASYHEGYAVILEELEEFWELAKAKEPDVGGMLAELVQVAAMAERTIEDVLLTPDA